MPNAKFKKDIMSALTPGADLGLNSDQKSQLMKNSESYLDKIMEMAGGSNSDKDKISSIKDLTKKNNSMFSSIFGDEDIVKKYKKGLKKSIRPYKRKYQLAKFSV